jgi:GNAT superfamily N-acetyltransferase
MEIVETETLTERQQLDILHLWNSEYPKDLSLKGLTALQQYLDMLYDKHHILLVDGESSVKGWLIYFIRDNEQCFAMLLDRSLQGQGWGSRLLDRAKEKTSELHGWVIDSNSQLKLNGEKYRSPIGFYVKNGFKVREDVQLEKNGINGIRVTWKI